MPDLIVGDRGVLDRKDFPSLFKALNRAGYDIIGPTVRE